MYDSVDFSFLKLQALYLSALIYNSLLAHDHQCIVAFTLASCGCSNVKNPVL